MTDPRTSYRTPARLFHWIVALLVFLMIPAGVMMIREGLPRDLQNALFVFHKNVGVIVLLVVLARLAYRRLVPPPPLPELHAAGAATHRRLEPLGALCAARRDAGWRGTFASAPAAFPIEWLDRLGVPTLVPRSDAIAEVAKSVHFFGSIALGALVALHVGAALFHGIIRRDGVFSRMWPPVR